MLAHGLDDVHQAVRGGVTAGDDVECALGDEPRVRERRAGLLSFNRSMKSVFWVEFLSRSRSWSAMPSSDALAIALTAPPICWKNATGRKLVSVASMG